ncbi:MAG: integration host factor subunit alpha [Rickettsiales bacterium]|nr:integration host factor subunit alpha [Rickettsiales bacterium]
MANTLTRSNIAESVQRTLGFSFSESVEIVDSLVEEMCKSIEASEELKISSFGSFVVNSKRARVGRNPKTKKEAVIAPRKVVSFYASNVLNDEINK